MPFGKKKGPEDIEFDFDYISETLIKPAIAAAGLMPIRADAEQTGGIIHKAMYERLALCDYAVADVSTVNANVYYELGMRHTVKPYTTICIMSDKTKLAFDLNLNRTYTYQIDQNGKLLNVNDGIKAIADKLMLAKQSKSTDSPVYQLVDGISFQKSLAHEKTDIFRDKVHYEQEIKDKLSTIRNYFIKEKRSTLLSEYVATALVPIENQETGVLIDVMLSYRALSCWQEMIDWIKKMPEYVFNTQMVQEQYGFALNRNKERDKAAQVLEALVKTKGANPETNGILGRVYKDLADESSNKIKAESFSRKSIRSYLSGFEADIRDAYPGINAVTLMVLANDNNYLKYMGTVKLAVTLKMKTKKADYWDYATLLELAVLQENKEEAKEQLLNALGESIEGTWMTETTMNNLLKIQKAFAQQGKDTTFIEEIIEALKA